MASPEKISCFSQEIVFLDVKKTKWTSRVYFNLYAICARLQIVFSELKKTIYFSNNIVTVAKTVIWV